MNSQYFVYKLLAPRPTFPADITDDEAAIMRQHAQYWAGLLGSGHAVMYENGKWLMSARQEGPFAGGSQR